MNRISPVKSLPVLCLAVCLFSGQIHASDSPLKVFLLAGQSNMQGHATATTLKHLTLEQGTMALHEKIFDESGEFREYDDVRIAYLSGAGQGEDYQSREKSGPLKVGFGAARGGPKVGPELTFGITMHERLGEPILLIKTAWGGKSLNTDFRPPSADEHFLEQRRESSGVFYRRMIDYVNRVLADPGRYHPAYDPDSGYEIAGFVWFQGFNDSIDKRAYPDGDYTAYSDLLAHLIRDVRRDLQAPGMPFVIGVAGGSGRVEDIRHYYEWNGIESWFKSLVHFREVMEAPASLPEFRDNVAAVRTENYMDPELVRVEWEVNQFAKGLKHLSREKREARLAEKFTERELMIVNEFVSNRGYHYFGSGKFFALLGEAFAEAILRIRE